MQELSNSRTRQPKSATRAQILRTAYAMYLERELEPGNERLSDVLDRLGYTTGAAYQIWPNQAAFREDLALYVAENIEYATLHPVADRIQGLTTRDVTFEENALAAGDNFARSFLQREEFFLTLRFFAMPDDRPDEITEALRDAYERSSWETGELFKAALELFGRRLKEPLTMKDLTAAATALLEGYALRSRVDAASVSDSVDWQGDGHHMFSICFLALLNEMTEPC